MNQAATPILPPLAHARHAIAGMRRTARLGLLLPVPLILIATVAMVVANLYLFQNAFLTFFLAIIFVIFVTGQVLALLQLRAMRPSLESMERTVDALIEAGEKPDLEDLRRRLEQVPPGSLRDLILRWTDLGLRGSSEGYETLLEDALDRRNIKDGRTLAVHATINRTTLKLGFLGTLIGIILTFPPMKRAVLGLADSEGELKFIRDIALAIDGDQYAILSTLVAVGLSILVEFVTIQLLERILVGFELVQSDINDWNALSLQPAIAGRRDGSQLAELEAIRERADRALVHAQQTLENHLMELTGAMRFAGLQLEQITQLQSQLGERVARLAEYEKQYRDFLSGKYQAAVPDGLRGSPE